jgi:hypothetical protein
MRRQSNDGDSGDHGTLLVVSYGPCGCKAIHIRHLTVHKHQVIGCPDPGCDGFAPIGDSINPVAKLLEHAYGDFLVDGIVFGEQHIPTPRWPGYWRFWQLGQRDHRGWGKEGKTDGLRNRGSCWGQESREALCQPGTAQRFREIPCNPKLYYIRDVP